MISLQKSMFVDRPVEDVFAFVTDPANDPQWRNNVEISEITSEGPLGVGSTIRYISKFLGRELDFTAEVTVYEPPRQICFTSAAGPLAFDVRNTTEEQDGGTLISFTGEMEVGGFFSMAEGMVAKQFEGQVDEEWDRLKALLEE